MSPSTVMPALVLLFSLLVVCTHSIPVNVMLPLDTVSNDGVLNNPDTLFANLQKLKMAQVSGVMTDVWWGVVERAGPKQYNWTAWQQLVDMVEQVGLRIQFVTSFHQCGGNVGDECNIPLPQWVLDIGKTDPNIFYQDREGSIDVEYLTLGVDHRPVLGGRTGIQAYSDFMSSLSSTFRPHLAKGTIDQIQVGMGPSGELRYPSYQPNKWTYCGIGEFQCYDSYMMADLQQAANDAGHPEWGTTGPANAGAYNSKPSETGFFSDNGGNNYASNYGRFFLNWYSGQLLNHSDSILGAAEAIFGSYPVTLAAKVAGIHWWYATDSHAAELTAGYYNTNENNGYLAFAKLFNKYNAHFDFTALELVNEPNSCGSAPETLVKQTILAAKSAGIRYAGENALELCSGSCDKAGFDEIIRESVQFGAISGFTYLRLTPSLVNNTLNYQTFSSFVATMVNSF